MSEKVHPKVARLLEFRERVKAIDGELNSIMEETLQLCFGGLHYFNAGGTLEDKTMVACFRASAQSAREGLDSLWHMLNLRLTLAKIEQTDRKYNSSTWTEELETEACSEVVQ